MEPTVQSNSDAASEEAPDIFYVQQLAGYCLIEFSSNAKSSSWEQMEAATNSTIELLRTIDKPRLLIDLSGIDTLQSGLVGSLVRIWKSLNKKTRRLVVYSPNKEVQDVLSASGLTKLWTVTETREEGAYELGVSQKLESQERELRILAITTLPCAIISLIALSLMLFTNVETVRSNSQLSALLLGGMSLATGIMSVVKDGGSRRMVSAFAIVISVISLSTLVFDANPIKFRASRPSPTIHEFK